jgi:IclR family acetate operon transcriptional repressor
MMSPNRISELFTKCGKAGQIPLLSDLSQFMPATKSISAMPNKTAKPTRERDTPFSRAVVKALEVLEFLQTEQPTATLNEIAKQLNLSKTSTFRLLRTLEMTNCLTLTGWGQYQLAPGIQAVARTQWFGRLLRVGMPHLQGLSRELSETASLAALFENHIEVIAVVESPCVIRMSNVVGHILPPNASSLGKVITAFQPPERREKLVRSYGTFRFTDHTITDQTELSREFERVLNEKFAIDREESVYDGVCFAVPIFAPGEQVSAAISVSIPKVRLRDAEQEQSIKDAVRATAERFASELQSA